MKLKTRLALTCALVLGYGLASFFVTEHILFAILFCGWPLLFAFVMLPLIDDKRG